jgi:hypothetical protein
MLRVSRKGIRREDDEVGELSGFERSEFVVADRRLIMWPM